MTVEPLEYFLVASPDVLPLCHDFCRPGPRKWRSTPRDVAIFSLSIFFFGCAKDLGICEATKDRSYASSNNREKKEHLEELQIETAFMWRRDVIGLQMLLWRIQTDFQKQVWIFSKSGRVGSYIVTFFVFWLHCPVRVFRHYPNLDARNRQQWRSGSTRIAAAKFCGRTS